MLHHVINDVSPAGLRVHLANTPGGSAPVLYTARSACYVRIQRQFFATVAMNHLTFQGSYISGKMQSRLCHKQLVEAGEPNAHSRQYWQISGSCWPPVLVSVPGAVFAGGAWMVPHLALCSVEELFNIKVDASAENDSPPQHGVLLLVPLVLGIGKASTVTSKQLNQLCLIASSFNCLFWNWLNMACLAVQQPSTLCTCLALPLLHLR